MQQKILNEILVGVLVNSIGSLLSLHWQITVLYVILIMILHINARKKKLER